jgi:preprotein translocase subunit SecG
MKKIFLTIVFFQISFVIFCQNELEDVLSSLKKRDYDKAFSLVETIRVPEIQSLILFNINYYIEGNYQNRIKGISLNRPLSTRDSILYYHFLGDYYKIVNEKNNRFLSCDKALKIANKLGEKRLIFESLDKKIEYLIYNKRGDTLEISKLLKKLQKVSSTRQDNFWFYYRSIQAKNLIKDYKLSRQLLKPEEVKDYLKKEVSNLFDSLKVNSLNVNYYKGKYYKLLSTYQADWLKDYQKSNRNLLIAKSFFIQYSYYETQDEAKGTDFNRAMNYFNTGDFQKAIPLYKENLKRKKSDLYKKNNYTWLYKSYAKLSNYKLADFYDKKADSIKEKLKIEEDDIQRFEANENENNFKLEEEKNKKLSKTLATIIPILGVVTLILILIFYLYKRYKKKSTILEEEKTETLQEIAELKKIVIKNHIILKDKTKVYVTDLMYIKSDDHYLRINTQEGNERMVRGKLSQIKEELPPNFIQCHRSYIVNSNFIKQVNSNYILLINKEQIPLSRSYKDKF